MPVPSAATVFRDFALDGVPSSGDHQVKKVDARAWGTWLESLIAAGALGDNWYATKSLLNADLAHDAGTVAVVYDDATAANNGTYIKVGASGSGSWSQKTTFLPGYQFVTATDDGTSTANAYSMDTSPRLPAGDGVALVSFVVPATNTSTTVTVGFDGGAAKTIKTASGNDPAIGGLDQGMPVFGIVVGGEFLMRSDQTSAAIQAAAEAAKDAAEAAAASVDTRAVADRAALKALDTNTTTTAILAEDAGKAHGRFGRFFMGLYSDWSSIVAVDTLEGYVIRSTFDDTKVWVRDCETLIPQHFGAAAAGNGNDAPALNCFYNVCITARKAGRIPASETTYYCTEQVFWDMSQRTSGAPDILGDSAYGARIHFQNGVASPNLKISGPDAFAIFYHRFGNFSVTGNTPGIVLQIGEDDFSDALNGCIVEYMRVGNANQTSGAIACRLNWLLRSKIVIGANSATSAYAGTVAMNCRRLQACELWGAVGNTDIGILFDMNNQYGNTFHGFDYETLLTAIKVTASIRDNRFAGGMAAINDTFVDATAGVNNVVDGVNFAASVTEIIKNQDATDATWGGVGFSIINKREASIHAFPALSTVGSGGWTRNAGGQPVMVSLYGGTVTSVYIRRVPSAGSGQQVASATGCQFLVQPGEEWQVNYSVIPNQNVRVAG